jgi:hypothetical protein
VVLSGVLLNRQQRAGQLESTVVITLNQISLVFSPFMDHFFVSFFN